MTTRETSRSRGGGGAPVDVAHNELTAAPEPTAPELTVPEVEVHADLSAAADVKSLVPPPLADAAPPAEVAGIEPPSAPAPSPQELLDEVKSLVAADSPAAEMTGVVETAPAVPPVVIEPPRPRRMPRIPAPRVRAPKIAKPKMRPIRMPARVRTFDSFRYGDYVLLWLATAFSSGGFWLQQVIVGWLAYDVTGSAFWTSLALGLDALPILFVGPLGGLLVDKLDRRKLMAWIYAYQAAVTSAFAAVVLLGALQTWHIFAFIFFMGLSWVISDPARMSLIPNIVPRERLVNAFALNSMAFSVTRLAAPAVGGLLIAGAGVGYALAVEVALQLCAAAAVIPLKAAAANKRSALRLGDVFRDLAEGARYVLNMPVILMLFALAALPAILVMPSIQGLMPVYAAEVFGVDARGLGLLLSAVGAGSTLGTFALASVGDIRAKGAALLVSVSVVALTTLAFSVNGLFQTAYINLMILSAATMTVFSITGAVVQGTVSDEFRGRVSGLYMITWGLYPFGSLASGYLADRFGAPSATQIAGCALILAFALGAWKFRRLWREI